MAGRSSLLLVCVITLTTFISGVCAQDPADGWLGYAAGVHPTASASQLVSSPSATVPILTYVEMTWKVGARPKVNGAFFSPWFGIESSDNLNLIQPVNPWSSNAWSIYNEYFQWSPVHNENSASHAVKPGDVLFGSVTYNPSNHSYTVYHSDLNDGWSVTSEITVQKDARGTYKNYTIIYVVFEKDAQCAQYPPDNSVTFYNIKVQYDNVDVSPVWTTGYVDNVCNNRANVINATTIEITWNSSSTDKPVLRNPDVRPVPSWMRGRKTAPTVTLNGDL